MDDLYGKHVAPPALSGSIPRSSLPSYFPAETSSMTSLHAWNSNDLRGASADYVPKDVLSSHARGYNFGDSNGIGGHRDPGLNGLMEGANIRGYPSMENLNVIGRRQDVAAGVSPAILDVNNGRPSSSRKVDGPPVATGESNLLFIDGLPTDCTRREVGHLFRPFIGFKDIRVVHKEPRRSVDKARVLCFVEFDDAGCALTALKALQGYKFDDRKPESPALRIHFAHFPFHLPSDHSTEQPGIP